MCAAADFIISRLVPTLSKAISTRASPPIFWMERIIPLPKALCWTMSPLRKSAGTALGAAETPAVTLSDISGHWAESTIRSLVAAGVVSGYDDGTYKPQNPVTKGEFIKLLLAANGTAIQSGFTNYEDVNKSWAKDNVYTALSLGICDNIAGSSSVFGVDDPITRVQAAALMGRLVGDGSGGTLSFTDAAAVPEWAAVPLADCAELGLITGMDDGSFAPDNNLTRAEAAVIVERVMDL